MHDEPPVSPSDSEEISPAPKARLRWLWRTLLGVALALLLALGAVAGLLASARDSAGLTRLVQVIEWGSGGRLTVAAAESAIGLAILVVLFRNLKTIHVDDLDSLKG